jgi:hypothetical protein
LCSLLQKWKYGAKEDNHKRDSLVARRFKIEISESLCFPFTHMDACKDARGRKSYHPREFFQLKKNLQFYQPKKKTAFVSVKEKPAVLSAKEKKCICFRQRRICSFISQRKKLQLFPSKEYLQFYQSKKKSAIMTAKERSADAVIVRRQHFPRKWISF